MGARSMDRIGSIVRARTRGHSHELAHPPLGPLHHESDMVVKARETCARCHAQFKMTSILHVMRLLEAAGHRARCTEAAVCIGSSLVQRGERAACDLTMLPVRADAADAALQRATDVS